MKLHFVVNQSNRIILLDIETWIINCPHYTAAKWVMKNSSLKASFDAFLAFESLKNAFALSANSKAYLLLLKGL